MKRVLITGAGGTPAINFTRSLRLAPEEFYLIGVDANEYYLQRAETDEKYLVKNADHPLYLQILKDIIKRAKPDFLYAQTDQEIEKISPVRDSINVKTFLPDTKTIGICQNKYESYKYWARSGIVVPKTILVRTIKDLSIAFKKFGSPVWVREAYSPGGGGRGSFKASGLNQAKTWIDLNNGWGTFTAAEYLSEHSVTWTSIWKNGELIVAQGRKRIYWEFANRAPSGVTGITGTGITVSDSKLDDLALKVIKAIDKNPSGIFAVDMTYDKKRNPNPTEINIGRFFTTHLFFTEAGLNMPYILIKCAFDEPLNGLFTKIVNPLKPGLAWIRGMDKVPVLTNVKVIENSKKDLKLRLKKITK